MLPLESRAHARRSLLRSTALVVVLVGGFCVLPLRGDRWWFGAVVGVAAIIATVPLTVKRVHAVRNAEQPTIVAIEAIVLLVSMLILGFSALYFAMDSHQDQFEGLSTRLDAVYYTVTTMATVGYGDIHPVGQRARFVVTLAMLMNLAFVGIVVRVLARAARGAQPDEP
ncbi:MAG: potassium channel family protein [Acidimicrobiales bacterium]